MPEPYELTASQAAAQIRQGTLSPVTLCRSLLDRIDRFDGDIRAWVTIDREEVLETARRRETEVERGDPLGPLHGVPVGLKDIFNTDGMLTTAGSRIYAEFVPDYDATSVARIRQAGGIILGKAVTTEFATSDPSPTRNPWNLEHTPGGSSSGSSAAVAARMVPAATGSQTGGSTCRPRRLQRYRWPEADLRAHQPLRSRSGQLVVGPCWHPGAQRGRRRADAYRDERL